MKYTILLLVFFLPILAHADVGNLQYTEGVVKGIIYNSNAFQTLGTGITGTATSLELYIQLTSDLAGYGQRPVVTLWECLESDYIDCTGTTLVAENFSTTIAPLQKYSYDVSFTFISNKYYYLQFDQSGFRGSYSLGASAIDTYANGQCYAGSALGRLISCTTSSGITTIFDIPFNFVGITFEAEHIPISLQSPVIFLPGILGSRLYVVENDGSLNKAWEGFTGSEMRKLIMNEDGESIATVRVGEVMTEFDFANAFKTDIYKSLEKYFECSPASTAPSFAPVNISDIPGNTDASLCSTPFVMYPYDWRYDVFDILDAGTAYTSNTTIRLTDLVKTLAQNSTGKVTILAHSNGGLLAKALMVRLEEEGRENLIDKVVVIGSPQLGTPQAIGAMLHGYKQNILGGFIKNAKVSRTVSLNAPGAYGLLPSAEYFSNTENEPVIYFDESSKTLPYRNIFGESINTFSEFLKFTSDSVNLRNQPSEKDLNSPLILNQKLLAKTTVTHAKIDAWTPPEGLGFIQIAGIGNETPTGFEYTTKGVTVFPQSIGGLRYSKRNILDYKPIVSLYGDSEVVSSSSGSSVGKTYYFDFGKLLTEANRDRDHLSFLTEQEVLKSIEEILTDKNTSSEYIFDERPDLSEAATFAISVHSPVLFSVTTGSGQTTSITYDSDTELFEPHIGIPGSSVELIGEGKYIFIPESENNYTVEITGIDTGSFNLILSEINENGRLREIEKFTNIPVTDSSTGTVSIANKNFSELSIDLNGNSATDFTFTKGIPNTDEITTLLKNALAELPLRPKLHSAIRQYFELIEETNDSSDRINYISQIKRIIVFLNQRYISQDTADEWTALINNLQ